MWIWGLFAVIVVAAIVFWFFGPRSRRGEAGSERLLGKESPEEILEQRLARGEIDRDTYERMLSELKEEESEANEEESEVNEEESEAKEEESERKEE